MKDTVADVLMFTAVALVTAGAALIYLPAGLIVAGVGLGGIAYLIGTKR